MMSNICEAIKFMHAKGVCHQDLKPENILLKNPKRTAIKLIDFGSSCNIGKTMYPYIQSRFYRSPEVLLGMPYNQAIDCWSLGCILYELHTGDPIFNGSSEQDQIFKITELLGMPPDGMLESGSKTQKYFRRVGSIWERMPVKKRYGNPGSRSLAVQLGSSTGGPGGRRAGEAGHTEDDYRQFEDLLRGLLHLDPELRMTPRQALEHAFLRGSRSNHPST